MCWDSNGKLPFGLACCCATATRLTAGAIPTWPWPIPRRRRSCCLRVLARRCRPRRRRRTRRCDNWCCSSLRYPCPTLPTSGWESRRPTARPGGGVPPPLQVNGGPWCTTPASEGQQKESNHTQPKWIVPQRKRLLPRAVFSVFRIARNLVDGNTRGTDCIVWGDGTVPRDSAVPGASNLAALAAAMACLLSCCSPHSFSAPLLVCLVGQPTDQNCRPHKIELLGWVTVSSKQEFLNFSKVRLPQPPSRRDIRHSGSVGAVVCRLEHYSVFPRYDLLGRAVSNDIPVSRRSKMCHVVSRLTTSSPQHCTVRYCNEESDVMKILLYDFLLLLCGSIVWHRFLRWLFEAVSCFATLYLARERSLSFVRRFTANQPTRVQQC